MDISELSTPSLLLDRAIMRENVARMAKRIDAPGCDLRPHVKTHKSRDVLAEVMRISGNQGITVSTLHEARYFAGGGIRDILYAVGMTPDKVREVAELQKCGVALTAITDSAAMAHLLAQSAAEAGITLPLLIELDVDGHRSGIDPAGDDLLAVAKAIDEHSSLILRGVMTHAGGSYDCQTLDCIRQRAREERERTVQSARRLRAAGHECSVVSIGSTPTACVVENLEGVTEIRPGVYTFFDLFQAGLGVASLHDIALSVLTTVIGHQSDKGWVIVDAGWMAMSRDRGTEKQAVDQGYGLVCALDGKPVGDVVMGGANQEHGILMAREGGQPIDLARFPVGSRWRVLPNHACATAGQYDAYEVLDDNTVIGRWERTRGW